MTEARILKLQAVEESLGNCSQSLENKLRKRAWTTATRVKEARILKLQAGEESLDHCSQGEGSQDTQAARWGRELGQLQHE